MENNLLNISLFDEYSIKELTKEEFREKTHYESDREALTNLFVETIGNADLSTLHVMQARAENLLSRLKGISRSFGIYFSDEYVGYISFANYDSETPEIQIELAESYRSKGIGFRALSLLTNRIFEERQDIEYFIYYVRVNNIVSIKLIEKLGGRKIETGDFVEQIISEYRLFR